MRSITDRVYQPSRKMIVWSGLLSERSLILKNCFEIANCDSLFRYGLWIENFHSKTLNPNFWFHVWTDRWVVRRKSPPLFWSCFDWKLLRFLMVWLDSSTADCIVFYKAIGTMVQLCIQPSPTAVKSRLHLIAERPNRKVLLEEHDLHICDQTKTVPSKNGSPWIWPAMNMFIKK